MERVERVAHTLADLRDRRLRGALEMTVSAYHRNRPRASTACLASPQGFQTARQSGNAAPPTR
ncbi:MAG TPA: hypothetical protein VFU47_15555 [Armatimonadota bacterium]|nr:hypothetical protein [Armatimonadota bacterium]